MSAQEVIFYDLPSKDGKSWSLNPWKTRLYLNYKHIPYTTHWLEYPDIAPYLKAKGLEPNAKGTAVADYTIPTLALPNGQIVMESLAIAQELEKFYPEPKLVIDPALTIELRGLILSFVRKCPAVFIVGSSRNLLNEKSVEYFNPSRAKWYKKERFEEIAETADERADWENLREGAEKLGEYLGRNTDGPFLLGKEVTFADFVVVGMLQWTKRIDEAYFERFVGFEPKLRELFDASKPWLERADH